MDAGGKSRSLKLLKRGKLYFSCSMLFCRQNLNGNTSAATHYYYVRLVWRHRLVEICLSEATEHLVGRVCLEESRIRCATREK